MQNTLSTAIDPTSLTRLRFPAILEAVFQRDYFDKWRRTMTGSALASALLLIPAAVRNVEIGLWAAVIANAVALVGCFVYVALLKSPQAPRFWQVGGFVLACLDTLAFDLVNVTATPRLAFVHSPEHAIDLFLLIQGVLLVYIFVVGRFQLRWYAAYAIVSVLCCPIFIGAAFADRLPYLFGSLSISVLAAAILLTLLAFYQERTARGEFLANHLLALERERSERLLLNILPGAVADRLKEVDASIADDFEEAGVLFADIVDFTPLAARLPAADVVRLLNEVFTAFDGLAQQYGLEKIKTIGDAYMAAAGLPEPHNDHAAALAEMALAMQEAATRFRRDDGTPLRIRVGVNIGPVVAGVIGRQKFIYDLWGDTVNVASRLESHGRPGQIHMTEAAYRLLRDRYEFAPPESIELKGRGAMSVYALRGRRRAAPGVSGSAVLPAP